MTIKSNSIVDFRIYRSQWLNRFVILSLLLLCGKTIFAQPSYSPYAETTYATNLYWGDTHLHTNLSLDANLYGNKRLGLEDAYRFAKGEVITAHNGLQARLSQPLDFIVVADHAFNMGLFASLGSADPLLLKTSAGKRLYDQWKKIQEIVDLKVRYEASRRLMMQTLFPTIDDGKGTHTEKQKAAIGDGYAESVWQRVTAKADKHNEPGKFTAFIGYEWTSMSVRNNAFGSNHRNVIFKDSAEKTNQIRPFSSFDSMNPEDLWQFLHSYEQTTGGEALAIPHNGNLSAGQMFSLVDFNDKPIHYDYAKTRSRWEPLYEVTQIKGDSEAHPLLSPDDNFSDYETWDGYEGEAQRAWKKSEYARSALKLGLDQQFKLGVNPFKFGLVGSTDAHTSLAAVEEDNFWGKTTAEEPSSKRLLVPSIVGWKRQQPWIFAASGYAGIWAQENTRESLFAAMKRKEVYATTGPRITVRFFGGWDYDTHDAKRPDLAAIGYRKGVPMGGDLTNAPADKSPQFLIRAVKDPEGANLDRVQVIKGWHDTKGELHEKIYNVSLSDNRKPNWRGKVKPVGNTVDIPNASYTNTIGDPELSIVWQDPDFNKNELAFYYVRVLEIPTPRWTAYDANYFDLKDIPEEVPMVTQERAYTSPIWYSPAKSSNQEKLL